MITGFHAIVYSAGAEEDRAFLRDRLGFRPVDAGGGWLIFALPPAELAVHPADVGGVSELYLMCDDIQETLADLKARGVEVSDEVSDQGWGLLGTFKLPSGISMPIYEPRHPTPTRPDRSAGEYS